MEELVLTAEELYFLGKLMGGHYIDYAYIAAMGDIQKQKALHDQNCRMHLVSVGAVEEDFWENLTVSEEVKEILEPVFFGEVESEAAMISYLPDSENYDMRFHWLHNECCMVTIKERKIIVRKITEKELAGIVLQLMPEGYNDREVPETEFVELGKRERAIVLKNTVFNESAAVYLYDVRNGWLCWQNGKGEWEVLSPGQFLNLALKILKGDVVYGISK